MRVLVTRAEPAASRTVEKLSANGFTPVVCPIFELVDLGNPLPDQQFSHFIFTSSNAVEIFKKRNWSPPSEDSCAWCVGETTKKAAKSLGFAHTFFAEGGGAKLVELIEKHNPNKAEKFLYPTTPDRTFDMERALKPLKFEVSTLNLYQMAKNTPEADCLRNFFSVKEKAAILIYSERSARHFADLVEEFGIDQGFEEKCIIAISQTATNILLKYPWRGVYVASRPNETSMLSMLEEAQKS